MFIATVVVSVLLAALLVVSATGKVRDDPAQLKSLETIRFPVDKVRLLAVAEFAGAFGLVVGLFWWPLGVAAAIGVIAYFLGAVTFHLRADDSAKAASFPLILAVVALVLRLMTT